MELARAKVSKFVREKFAETKVNQQTLSRVYSCCAGDSTSARFVTALRGCRSTVGESGMKAEHDKQEHEEQ